MGRLSKAEILAAKDLKSEVIYVDDWQGEVEVKTLTAAELDDFESSVYDAGEMDLDNVRARLVVRCLVDAEGNRIFGDDEADLLGQKSAAAVDQCYEVASRLNKRSAKDMEELRKNSKGRAGS